MFGTHTAKRGDLTKQGKLTAFMGMCEIPVKAVFRRRYEMTQCERIIQYIKENGSLDRLQAFTELGIFELSARICKLEKQGYSFTKVRKTAKNRYGDTFSYVKYSFSEVGNVEK